MLLFKVKLFHVIIIFIFNGFFLLRRVEDQKVRSLRAALNYDIKLVYQPHVKNELCFFASCAFTSSIEPPLDEIKKKENSFIQIRLQSVIYARQLLPGPFKRDTVYLAAGETEGTAFNQ